MARRFDDDRTKEVLLEYAKSSMTASEAAKALYCEACTVHYHLNKAKKMYGLDPRNFFDLYEIVLLIKDEQKKERKKEIERLQSVIELANLNIEKLRGVEL